MATARKTSIELVERFRSKGINKHLTWIYRQGEKHAGVDRNIDVMDNKYNCFEGDLGHGEGCDTVWYPNLKSAREVVQKYLNGEIPSIPMKSTVPE